MPSRKPDLSRLVMLTMTPSEAALLKELLNRLRERIEDPPLAVSSVLLDVIDSIDLQLRHLKWPTSNKAPYPL